jgi:hypothetical protein
MKTDDSLRLFLLVIAIFIGFLFKPQITNWWVRRQRLRESEREAKLNRELRKRDR